MLITPDFSQTMDYVPLEEGRYQLRVVGIEQKISQKGDPYLSWQFEVFNAPKAILNGRKVFQITMLGGAMAFMLKKFIKALNPSYQGGAFNTEDYYGKEMEGKIEYLIDKRLNGEKSKYPSVTEAFPLPEAGSFAHESDLPF